MKLYNTLTHRVEELVPMEAGQIRMYSCGPTVYRYIHVGNLRTFTMADWLRRALEYRQIRVQHVKNITDVGHMRQERLDRGEDKLIAQARSEGKTSAEIAAFYTAAFLDDERQLNIQPAHIFPRATDHVPEMLEIVADLVAKDVAYEIDGNVFYDVTRFPNYGALSGNQLAQSLPSAQDATSLLKRHPEDFPIWKRAEPGREMAWDSAWGRGFPGWHIECSAMSIKYLGPHFDIHTGGVDNMFPHHEDEIAQSEAYTGQRFVNYWVHAQHLLCDGLKMAKSTGNAYTLADVIARGFEPMALRYFFTTARYRSRINFTFSALRAAEIGLNRLRHALLVLSQDTAEPASPAVADHLSTYHNAFLDAIENDLNIPRAMAVIWSLLRTALPGSSAADRLALVLDFDRILGLDLEAWLAAHRGMPVVGALQGSQLPASIQESVNARAASRQRGDYARADALRTQLAAQGFALRDTRDGTVLVVRRPEEGFMVIARSADTPDHATEPDRYDLSVNLVAKNSQADLARCIDSLLAHSYGRHLELVIVDNGSTDDTPAYLRRLVSEGLHDSTGCPVALQVFFADHDMGFAAARNATLRASYGRLVVLLDTSIELTGDIWTPIEQALLDPVVGLVGPYTLVTADLKEFVETDGPRADAVEGYLIATRRSLLSEIGLLDEKYRFYRLLDVAMSFQCTSAGYHVECVPTVAERLIKHPHREWFSLNEEERATRSKHNYDLFRRRWHHGESLLVANYRAADLFAGHDHPHHLAGTHGHTEAELPLPGTPHTHIHQHWPDHAHEHPHYHAHAQLSPGIPVQATRAVSLDD